MQIEATLDSNIGFKNSNRLSAYFNRKMLMMLLLGFSSGLPLALCRRHAASLV